VIPRWPLLAVALLVPGCSLDHHPQGPSRTACVGGSAGSGGWAAPEQACGQGGSGAEGGATGGSGGSSVSQYWWEGAEHWRPVDLPDTFQAGCRLSLLAQLEAAPALVPSACGPNCRAWLPALGTVLWNTTIDARLLGDQRLALLSASQAFETSRGLTTILQWWRLDTGSTVAALRVESDISEDGFLTCSIYGSRPAGTMVGVAREGTPAAMLDGILAKGPSVAWLDLVPAEGLFAHCAADVVDDPASYVYFCDGGLWQRFPGNGGSLEEVSVGDVLTASANGGTIGWVGLSPGSPARVWLRSPGSGVRQLGQVETAVPCKLAVLGDSAAGIAGTPEDGWGCARLGEPRFWGADDARGVRLGPVFSQNPVGVTRVAFDRDYVAASLAPAAEVRATDHVYIGIARTSDWTVRALPSQPGEEPLGHALTIANGKVFVGFGPPPSFPLSRVLCYDLQAADALGAPWPF
jgi:hypothetical protein